MRTVHIKQNPVPLQIKLFAKNENTNYYIFKNDELWKYKFVLKTDIENNRLPKLGNKTEKGIKLLRLLFENPIVTAGKVVDEMGISYSTANRLLSDFEKLKIIEEYTGFKRNRKFIFKEYFGIFNNETRDKNSLQ